jgi:hypothetical protein
VTAEGGDALDLDAVTVGVPACVGRHPVAKTAPTPARMSRDHELTTAVYAVVHVLMPTIR